MYSTVFAAEDLAALATGLQKLFADLAWPFADFTCRVQSTFLRLILRLKMKKTRIYHA